jgi:hypothetical protein
VKSLCIDLLQSPYELSDNWLKMHDVPITEKQFLVRKDIVKAISLLKLKKIIKMKHDVELRMKELATEDSPTKDDELIMCMKETMQLQSIITKLAKDTGTTILPVVH